MTKSWVEMDRIFGLVRVEKDPFRRLAGLFDVHTAFNMYRNIMGPLHDSLGRFEFFMI